MQEEMFSEIVYAKHMRSKTEEEEEEEEEEEGQDAERMCAHLC